MNIENQHKAEELFAEKDELLEQLEIAKKHKDWNTYFKVSCSNIQVTDFVFKYQDVNKMILLIIISKIEARLKEIDSEIKKL